MSESTIAHGARDGGGRFAAVVLLCLSAAASGGDGIGSIHITLRTGEVVIGRLLNHTEDVVVLEHDGLPCAIAYRQMTGDSAYPTRHAILVAERGGRKNLTAGDLHGLGVLALEHDRVAAAREQQLPEEELTHLTELFRLLGDVTRARLLYALLEAGELCVCDLAAATGTPETNVSHALRLLRTAGVVKARRDGRMMHYSLHDAHVRMLLDLSREHLRHTVAEK